MRGNNIHHVKSSHVHFDSAFYKILLAKAKTRRTGDSRNGGTERTLKDFDLVVDAFVPNAFTSSHHLICEFAAEAVERFLNCVTHRPLLT